MSCGVVTHCKGNYNRRSTYGKGIIDMKLNFMTLFWVFIWSIFMGITAGSIGVGAVVPSANLIAKPFICPNGSMQHESQVYTVSPVETVTTLTWYCVDARTGTSTELGIFPMSLYAGTFYGLVLFAVILIGMLIVARRRRTKTIDREVWSPADAAFESALSNADREPSAPSDQAKIRELSQKVREMQSELEELKRKR